jgi:UDP:flavonoid glycosyltransferase YjiC (YdhE family)
MRSLLTSWGSRGDLHPFLALGRGLVARGHEVTLVGHPEWAAETAQAGLRFVATNEPPRDDFLRQHPEIMSQKWGGLTSLRALVQQAIAPSFAPVLDALLAEAPAHDVIIAHHFVFPAPIAAELTGKPWATVSLAPGVVPSDFSRPGTQSSRAGTGFLGRKINRLIWTGGRFVAGREIDPLVNRLRAQHGLAPIRDAMFGAHSEKLNLQLYNEKFAPRPDDWSPEKQYGGFCFYDPPDEKALAPEVEKFLTDGPPPVLFTLGSAAVHLPGDFYQAGVDAVSSLGLRGILLLGRDDNRPARVPSNVLAISYASYGLLMPRVRAVVHQAGIGTLSHILRAGLPSVAVPFAFDQPNNARRLHDLGVAEVLPPGRRGARAMAAALQRLLAARASDRARRLGGFLRAEDGVAKSCAVLESVFDPARRPG